MSTRECRPTGERVPRNRSAVEGRFNLGRLAAAGDAISAHERACVACQDAMDGHGRCPDGERLWSTLVRWNHHAADR